MNKRCSLIDREYIIRLGLIFIISISFLIMIWNFKFTSDVVLSFNETNKSAAFDANNWTIDNIGQEKIKVVKIDRELYSISPAVFVDLPFVPYNWGEIKYAFDSGYYSIISRVSEDFYLQPEFYDDWFSMGLRFHANPRKECKAGIFSTPSWQRLSTSAGAEVDTFIIVRSSFCVSNPQGLTFVPVYPVDGSTDDGEKFTQDPSVVKRYISLKFLPDDVVLGRTYPRFDDDWASKIKVTVSVSDSAPRGTYIVAVGADKFDSYLGGRKYVNKEAYVSRSESPLMYLIVSVD